MEHFHHIEHGHTDYITPTLTMNDKHILPTIGLSIWDVKKENITKMIKNSISIGYRHIDCSPGYHNEKEIGNTLKEAMLENSLKREDLFITSKVWNSLHQRKLVVECLQQTLSDLKIAYLDLYYVQWPFVSTVTNPIYMKDKTEDGLKDEEDYMETWRGMQDCVQLRLTKSIGLSNFNSEQINRIYINATIKPAIIQIECHLFLNQMRLIEFCNNLDILVSIYAPFGEIEMEESEPASFMNETIQNLCLKYEKTPAQILVRYQLQRELVVIVRAISRDRLLENMNVFDFTISNNDMELLNTMNRNERAVTLKKYQNNKHYPFNIPF